MESFENCSICLCLLSSNSQKLHQHIWVYSNYSAPACSPSLRDWNCRYVNHLPLEDRWTRQFRKILPSLEKRLHLSGLDRWHHKKVLCIHLRAIKNITSLCCLFFNHISNNMDLQCDFCLDRFFTLCHWLTKEKAEQLWGVEPNDHQLSGS